MKRHSCSCSDKFEWKYKAINANVLLNLPVDFMFGLLKIVNIYKIVIRIIYIAPSCAFDVQLFST